MSSHSAEKARKRRWYHRNKATLLVKRRERFAKNAVVRDRNRARCRDYYRRKKGSKPVIPVGLRRRPRFVAMSIRTPDGQSHVVRIVVVTVAYFARRIGIKRERLLSWESNGFIPKFGQRLKDGTRIWPLLFVDIVREVMERRPPRVGFNMRRFNLLSCAEIVKLWNKRKVEYLTNPNYGCEGLDLERPFVNLSKHIKGSHEVKEASRRDANPGRHGQGLGAGAAQGG